MTNEVDEWFAERRHPLTDAMQLARKLILDADSEYANRSSGRRRPSRTRAISSASIHRRSSSVCYFIRGAEIQGDFPRLVGDGPLVRVMRFADVNEVEAGRDELQAVIRAWCNAH